MYSSYFNWQFNGLEGGLFSEVKKADVGENSANLMAKGYELLGWADPFFPDPSMPKSVSDAMKAGLAEGTMSHYTMPIGSLELRQEVAKKWKRYNHFEIDPSCNVLVTPGSDSGLLFAMMPILREGDEVLVPDPSYPSNFLNCRLCGAKAVHVPLRPENHYQIDIRDFEERATPKTRMVILTHPNNPTGTVFSKESIEALCAFCVRRDLVLICDQAFEDHIFDGREFVTPAAFPGMWDRTVTVTSLSKGYGLSGLRVGFLVGHEKVMDIFYGAAVNVVGATCTLSQLGAIAALRDETILPAYKKIFCERRDMAYEFFHDIPGVHMEPSESGILSWMDVHELGTDEEVAAYLEEHAHVVVNEGHNYGEGGKGCLRFLHACHRDKDKAAAVFGKMRDALLAMGRER